jgi:hypothetical protein
MPADVARVVELYGDLGQAARRGLFLSERVAGWQVRQAALRAAILERRLRPRA